MEPAYKDFRLARKLRLTVRLMEPELENVVEMHSDDFVHVTTFAVIVESK